MKPSIVLNNFYSLPKFVFVHKINAFKEVVDEPVTEKKRARKIWIVETDFHLANEEGPVGLNQIN